MNFTRIIQPTKLKKTILLGLSSQTQTKLTMMKFDTLISKKYDFFSKSKFIYGQLSTIKNDSQCASIIIH